ncbi:MAG: molybdopterin biosynthesis protein [Thermodesulfobacteriota bacterium]
MSRRVYLRMRSLEEARSAFLERFPRGGLEDQEEIRVVDACGRVTARAVFAKCSAPSYHAAAMDGVAVRAEDTYLAHPERPLTLKLGLEAHMVNTGHPLPPGTNAVVMIEDVLELEEGLVQVESPVYPWEHVRRIGEDIVATELLFPQNHRLSAYDLGALLGGGVTRVWVRRRPRVALIPTGRELVDWEELEKKGSIDPGQVIGFNTVVLASLIGQWGGEPIRLPIVRDDPGELRNAVKGALGNCDVVIVNAGSSAGSEDLTVEVFEQMGEVLVHGISMMPGKPTVLAIIDGKPAIGNPGYPVSAVVSCEEIVKPLLARLLGVDAPSRPRVRALASRKIACRIGMEELVRVRLGEVGGKMVATALPRAAGSITSLTKADGILRVPRDVEGYDEGEQLEVELLRTPEEIRRTIVAIGSHDLTLDLIHDRLRAQGRGYGLASSNVGSLGGLIAVRKGQAHLAGTHLLDPETGEYNFPYLRRYLHGVDVRMVHLAYREQGLMVAAGNPLGIHGIQDLTRPAVRFINRQAGSGTRVLLDFHLRKLGIRPEEIQGYSREEYTHMAVAVAVASGAADVGMGILAAARALGLEFIPVCSERYDLVIPTEHFDTEGIQLLLAIIGSEEFRELVRGMGGYDPSESGKCLL